MSSARFETSWTTARGTALALCLLSVVHPGAAVAQDVASGLLSIHRLFQEDQSDRTTPGFDVDSMLAHDKEHRRVARQLLTSGALKTGQDFQDAAFIFQHGASPSDYILAHVMGMAAAEEGSEMGAWISAASMDRYLQTIGQPQVFGTQYRPANPGVRPVVIVQTPYDTTLVTDAMRREFCVSSRAEQAQNVVAANQHKAWPYSDGCDEAPRASMSTDMAVSPVHALFVEDQKDRSTPNADWDSVSAHDTAHREATRQMFDAGALETGRDFQDAAFIFQHGTTPRDYMLGHVLALEAMAKGAAGARWIAAATLDRYLQSVKQPQVFGTQYRHDHEGPKPDQATLLPYEPDLLTDAMRRRFCVSTHAEQLENVAALNQGKPFPSPDSCPAAGSR